MNCEKVPFSSPRKARAANRFADFRMHAYWCQECKAYHVSNTDKAGRRDMRVRDPRIDKEKKRQRQ